MCGMSKSVQDSRNLVARKPTYLRAWRRYFKISQERACESLDIDRTTLSRIETGKLPYNQDFLEQAAIIYGCDPQDFLDSDPFMPRETEVIRLLRRAPEPEKSRLLSMLETYLKTGTN